jgi:hypothetical protein
MIISSLNCWLLILMREIFCIRTNNEIIILLFVNWCLVSPFVTKVEYMVES